MDLRDAIEVRLPPDLPPLLRALGEWAASHQEGLYIVGGAVRDLMLDLPVRVQEVDLVLVGDVQRLAHEAESAGIARRTARSQFLTVKLEVAGRRGVDLVTARRESYARPGALPQVEPAGLEEDLRRRDFSINTLAASLHPRDFGQVVDICGGLADLQAHLVRALHERSFQDDATRILRAARYAARLGFRLEAETERWLRRDARYLDTISGDRLRHELDRLWQEPAPEDALSMLQALGALSSIHPSLHWDAALGKAFSQGRARRPPDIPLASLYLALLGSRMGPAEAQGFVARLKLPPQRAKAVRDAAQLAHVLGAALQSWEGADTLLPSRAVARLEGHDPAALLAWALTGPERQATLLRRYLEEWRHARPSLAGDALLALGVAPGPAVGEYLTRLRNARLDGLVTTEAEERALVARWLGLPERPA